jgi:hypothetical protein
MANSSFIFMRASIWNSVPAALLSFRGGKFAMGILPAWNDVAAAVAPKIAAG